MDFGHPQAIAAACQLSAATTSHHLRPPTVASIAAPSYCSLDPAEDPDLSLLPSNHCLLPLAIAVPSSCSLDPAEAPESSQLPSNCSTAAPSCCPLVLEEAPKPIPAARQLLAVAPSHCCALLLLSGPSRGPCYPPTIGCSCQSRKKGSQSQPSNLTTPKWLLIQPFPLAPPLLLNMFHDLHHTVDD
ncbi:hypothetical protein PCANC_02833 [Puccinia coronata f. sp. avenae]|uniref:Uncharacterized protein n=1 Tax=Puccinia coronata f. sp. avenae TaxID=200324 RepID=A0A2N5W462_9BASI|nr:hypothetical protein PCANC_02833 [Puccinia coronata f. sp. avenae]